MFSRHSGRNLISRKPRKWYLEHRIGHCGARDDILHCSYDTSNLKWTITQMVWKRMGDDSNLADSHSKWHSAKQCQVQSEKCVRVPLTPNVGDYQNIVIHREGVFISKFNYCTEDWVSRNEIWCVALNGSRYHVAICSEIAILSQYLRWRSIWFVTGIRTIHIFDML